MTPLYDVLSAWPVIGPGANQLPLQRAKLSMALRGRKRHYRLNEIQPRHWQALAQLAGAAKLWSRMRTFVESVEPALQRVEKILPADFPERVFTRIGKGMRKQAHQFLDAAAN